MASKSIRIHLEPAQPASGVIGIHEHLRRELGIPDAANEVTLKAGGGAITARVAPFSKKRVVQLDPNLAERLHLSLPGDIRIAYDPDRNTIALGPFVAVFAVRRKKRKTNRGSFFGARTLDMRELMRYGSRLGVVPFVVTPEGVKAEAGYLDGYVPAGKRWIKKRFPIPDVVYDRIQARSWERQPSAQRAKAAFMSFPHLAYFNQGFFDKWSIYERLRSSEALERYLPPTRQLTGPESLRLFLANHASVYLKPTEGSQGKGVIRVRRALGGYEWRMGSRRRKTKRFENLYRGVAKIQRGRRYIMQPDLGLATFGGAPFDVRLLMQKDGNGRWKTTKSYARIALRGQITSNISRGGTGKGLDGVLRGRFGKRRIAVRRRIRAASKSILAALEEILDGPLGEVGLDLGLDRNGRVWLIEVNSKPFRKVTDAGPKNRVRLSFQRPMAFAKYLAGF